MRKLLLIALALAVTSPSLFAEQIVVFAKGETMTLDDGSSPSVPKEPARRVFLSVAKSDFEHPTPFAAPLPLIAPPEWGKTVPNAKGQVEFHPEFTAGFLVRVRLEGLVPGHRYILTLNGNPKLAGNDRLANAVPGLPAERYMDFFTATTDEHGRYAATFAIALRSGPYDVRFYVKDTDDFKIVLYHDYFKFSVK
ncbi:MAG TPA: hypothetical protein VGM64_21680 [Lacunisphaera sp.]|jgi:hypothetical protein